LNFELYDVFYKKISTDFLLDSIRCLRLSYNEAFFDCKSDFSWQVAHDARPIVRRARFEEGWKRVAERYSMQTSFEQNVGKNCYHLRIVNSRVILTAALIDYRVKTVRPALYRNDYALGNQNFLFPEMNSSPIVDAPVYAILMHDVDPLYPWQPLYADIGFPDSTGKIRGRIRLAERFARVFSENVVETTQQESAFSGTVPVEHIEAPGVPVLRDDIKKKDTV